MSDTLLQVIQWAIPSGGIGAAIAWIANRKVKQAQAAHSIHDTYKVMYEDVSRLLMETQQKYEQNTILTEKLVSENNLTRRAVNRLTRAIEAIQICPHRADCPVSSELSLSDDNPDPPKPAKPLRAARPKARQQHNSPDTSPRDPSADHPAPTTRHSQPQPQP